MLINNYFSILSTGNIKTIILNTPEECLSANKIREKLIQEGHQLLPEALYPNEIRISYLEIENNQKNIIKTKKFHCNEIELSPIYLIRTKNFSFINFNVSSLVQPFTKNNVFKSKLDEY